MEIIWTARESGSLKWWALENSVGFLRHFLGIPNYTFHQWWFGGDNVKPTDVWGYFKEPARAVRKKPENIVTSIGKKSNGRGWAKPNIPKEYAYMKLGRAAARAITPAGIARGM